jgi:type IX secretion system PorP/SprF family membrane protein
MKKLLPSLLFVICLGAQSVAQDIHYTQFNMSPVSLNPANMGAFFGSYRVGAIFRTQWTHFADPYETPTIYIDAPIVRGFRAQDWVAVGGSFFQDKAGVARMTHGGMVIGGAYHLALNKSRKNVVTFGFSGGRVNRSINMIRSQILLEDELRDPNIALSSPDRSSIQSQVNYVDLNAGVLYTRKLLSGLHLRLGGSVMHLNRPRYRIRGGNRDNADRQPMRIVSHGELGLKIDDRWSVTPAFLYQQMSAHTEIQGQAVAGYLFSQEKDITLLGGLGYRLTDAVPIIAGIQWNQLRVGLSWDYNTSDVTPGGNGGFEIAASYIAMIYKKPKAKPMQICPRF